MCVRWFRVYTGLEYAVFVFADTNVQEVDSCLTGFVC